MSELISGEIQTADITELITELNNNKNKLFRFVFDRYGNGYRFTIENVDDKDQKKIYKIIDKHLKTHRGKVKREKNGITTDEVCYP